MHSSSDLLAIRMVYLYCMNLFNVLAKVLHLLYILGLSQLVCVTHCLSVLQQLYCILSSYGVKNFEKFSIIVVLEK